MKIPATLSYSVTRILLFVGTLLFVAVVVPGLSPIVALVIATVVSGILSYFLLAGPREAMARSVERRIQGVGRRLDAGAKAEDAALDAAEEARRRASTVQNPRESGEDATGRA